MEQLLLVHIAQYNILFQNKVLYSHLSPYKLDQQFQFEGISRWSCSTATSSLRTSFWRDGIWISRTRFWTAIRTWIKVPNNRKFIKTLSMWICSTNTCRLRTTFFWNIAASRTRMLALIRTCIKPPQIRRFARILRGWSWMSLACNSRLITPYWNIAADRTRTFIRTCIGWTGKSNLRTLLCRRICSTATSSLRTALWNNAASRTRSCTSIWTFIGWTCKCNLRTLVKLNKFLRFKDIWWSRRWRNISLTKDYLIAITNS